MATTMNKDSKIYIAGHRGLVGSAIHRKLVNEGYTNIIMQTSGELDLTDREAVLKYFNMQKPEYVFLTAARAGGVLALSQNKIDSLIDNFEIQTSVLIASAMYNVKKLLFIGSNCMYPKLASEPLKEEYIGAGKLEPTTEFYALAKIAGLKLCQAYNEEAKTNFITAIPVNLYGENDKYDLTKAHVMPALLKKFKEAKESGASLVEVWGTGMAKREFMHSDDLADACLFLMENHTGSEPVNVGSGDNISIKALAENIKFLVGYKGDIVYNTDMPDGISSKLLDSSKLYAMGWKPKVILSEGIMKVYRSL